MSVEIFGIRHHGPGSARSLLRALEAFAPDVVLIEGPPDTETLIPWVTDARLQPPVAMLVYNPKNLQQASFFPFAEFSPEWQAMKFALASGIPVRFMDLPMGISFVLKEQQTTELFATATTEAQALEADPFRRMALLAGYSDPERWWDALIERQAPVHEGHSGSDSIFPQLIHLMRALRDDKAGGETPETLLREAWMRQTLRQAQKDGFQRIAIVCGAWHSPALEDTDRIKASADAAMLKGLKKVKTECTWIPWSFDRLAAQSGYSAGIVAPAWYRILWDHPAHFSPAAIWLARAAELLRQHDLPVSSAHVLEASRLAETLAVLRQTALPGLDELREAATTVLCEGSEKMLDLIDRQLVIGDVLGAVPDALSHTPLQVDFEQQVRSCRLEKNTQEKSLELDLREASHLRKSKLLHRLLLLDMPWGKINAIATNKHGSFHENWELKWLPDFEIRLIEAGVWGSTVEEAATHKTRSKVRRSENLSELVSLLDAALKADLSGIVPDLMKKLRNVSALASDVLLLADALLPLAEVLRYGHARQVSTDSIEQLLQQVAPRVCLQLPAACIGIEEEVALDLLKKMMSVNRAFGILQEPDFEIAWAGTLRHIHQSEQSAPLLAGAACRLLFDKKEMTAADTGQAMRYHLAPSQAPMLAAQWLDGFLYGSGLLLLHYPDLWQILNEWVRHLPDEYFRGILPVLRRTFSRFTGPERSKMLDMSKNTGAASHSNVVTETDWDTTRTSGMETLLDLIFS